MFSYEIYLSCICYLWYLWVLVLYNIPEALCIFLRFYESVFYRYFLVYYFLSVIWDNSESVIFFRYPHMTDLWVCVCVSFIYSSVSLNKITDSMSIVYSESVSSGSGLLGVALHHRGPITLEEVLLSTKMEALQGSRTQTSHQSHDWGQHHG